MLTRKKKRQKHDLSGAASTTENRKMFRRRTKPSCPSPQLSSSLAASISRAKDHLTNLFSLFSSSDPSSPASIIVWYLEARDGVSLLTANKQIHDWITTNTRENEDESNSSLIIQWWRDQELLRIICCQRSLMTKLCNTYQQKQRQVQNNEKNNSWKLICKVEGGDNGIGAENDGEMMNASQEDSNTMTTTSLENQIPTTSSSVTSTTSNTKVEKDRDNFCEQYERDFMGMTCMEDMFYYFRQTLLHGYGLLGLFDLFSFGYRTADEEILGTLGGFGFPQDVLMQMKRYCNDGTISVVDHFNKVKQKQQQQREKEDGADDKSNRRNHRRRSRQKKGKEKNERGGGKGRGSSFSARTFLKGILPPLQKKKESGRLLQRRCHRCDTYKCPSDVIFYTIEKRRQFDISAASFRQKGGSKNTKNSRGLRGLRRVSSRNKNNDDNNNRNNKRGEDQSSSASSLVTEDTLSTYSSSEPTTMKMTTITELYCSTCMDKDIHLAFRFLTNISRSVKIQEKQYIPSYMMGLCHDHCCLLDISNEMIPLRIDDFMVNVRCHPNWDGDGDIIDGWFVGAGPRDPTVRYVMQQIDEVDELQLSSVVNLTKKSYSLRNNDSKDTLPTSNTKNYHKDDSTYRTVMIDIDETFLSGLTNTNANSQRFDKTQTSTNSSSAVVDYDKYVEDDKSLCILRHIEKMDEDARLLEKMMEEYSSSSSSSSNFSSLIGERTSIMMGNDDDNYYYDKYYDYDYYNHNQDDEKSRPSDACTKTTVTGTADPAYMNRNNCGGGNSRVGSNSNSNSSSLSSGIFAGSGGLNSYYYDSTFSSDDENYYDHSDHNRNKKGKRHQQHQVTKKKSPEKDGCQLQFAAFDPNQDLIVSSQFVHQQEQQQQNNNEISSDVSVSVEAAFMETDNILSNALAAFHKDMVDFSKNIVSI